MGGGGGCGNLRLAGDFAAKGGHRHIGRAGPSIGAARIADELTMRGRGH